MAQFFVFFAKKITFCFEKLLTFSKKRVLCVLENKTGVRFRVRKGALRDCYEKILGDEQMKSKANNVASRLLVIILAICITAGCCPAFSVAEADDVTVQARRCPRSMPTAMFL